MTVAFFRIQNIIERGSAARQAASRHLKALVKAGVLREITSGREKLFIHPELMRLLTSEDMAFAPYPPSVGA